MDAIEQIIAQMESAAESERERFAQAEKQRLNEAFAQADQQLILEFDQQKQRQLTELESTYRQASNRQQVESRRQLLNQKQACLNQLFTDAAQTMAAWPQEKMRSFADVVLQELPLTHSVLLITGEESQVAYNQEWLTFENKRLPYVIRRSDAVIKGQAGFIIDDAGVQYNFLFEALVKDIQSQATYEIAGRLFGPEQHRK